MPILPAVANRPLRRLCFLTTLGFFLSSLAAAHGETEKAEIPPFCVRFWADGIEITGTVPSRKDAVQLREVLYRVRNRLLLWDELEVVERESSFPNINALSGLIRELDLSTTSGKLRITGSAIIVSGLTDSLVTQAAFAARLEDLNTDGREIRNEICIVASGDLEDSNLARPDPPAPAMQKPPRDLPKPLVLYRASFGPEPPPASKPDPAAGLKPILLTEEAPGEMTSTEEKSPPTFFYRFEPMSSVVFAPDSFLIGASQLGTIQEAADSIRQLPASELPVILTGYPDNDGEHSYNDWIGRKRAQGVFEMLRGMGVAEKRLSLGNYRDGPTKREGTVTVFVPHMEKVVAIPVQQASLASPE